VVAASRHPLSLWVVVRVVVVATGKDDEEEEEEEEEEEIETMHFLPEKYKYILLLFTHLLLYCPVSLHS